MLKQEKQGKQCTFALLLGYGATAVNPYMAFETIDEMVKEGEIEGVD